MYHSDFFQQTYNLNKKFHCMEQFIILSKNET